MAENLDEMLLLSNNFAAAVFILGFSRAGNSRSLFLLIAIASKVLVKQLV